MKEAFEKIIERLEEQQEEYVKDYDRYGDGEDYRISLIYERAIKIVNQVAEEYKDRIFINGQCCWQSCACTEKCQECNRYTLSDSDIDWYESIEDWNDEFGKDINVRISNSEIPNMSEKPTSSNEFCEWKCDALGFIINPHTKRMFNYAPRMKNIYCNTCGKKIIVAPYKPKGD